MRLIVTIKGRLKRRAQRRRIKGQGITEYAFVIAFIAVLVACTFAFTKGALMCGVSNVYSSMVNQLNLMTKAGASAS